MMLDVHELRYYKRLNDFLSIVKVCHSFVLVRHEYVVSLYYPDKEKPFYEKKSSSACNALNDLVCFFKKSDIFDLAYSVFEAMQPKNVVVDTFIPHENMFKDNMRMNGNLFSVPPKKVPGRDEAHSIKDVILTFSALRHLITEQAKIKEFKEPTIETIEKLNLAYDEFIKELL